MAVDLFRGERKEEKKRGENRMTVRDQENDQGCSKRLLELKEIQKSIFQNSRDLRKETVDVSALLRLFSTLVFVGTY